MRFSLRRLVILTILGPPALAVVFWETAAFGFEVLLVEAVVLGIAVAVLAFCFVFLWGPR